MIEGVFYLAALVVIEVFVGTGKIYHSHLGGFACVIFAISRTTILSLQYCTAWYLKFIELLKTLKRWLKPTLNKRIALECLLIIMRGKFC